MYRTLTSICLVGIFACGSEEDKTPGPEDPRPPSQDGGFLFDVGIRERDTQAPRRDTQVVPDREIQPPDPDQGLPPPRPDMRIPPDTYVEPDQRIEPDTYVEPDQGVSQRPCYPGCRIDGECVALQAPHPTNACLYCDPDVSKNWAVWADVPGSCDDGDKCTYGDKCTAGVCKGTAYSCDDGISCTVDYCNGDGTCGQFLLRGCLIDGVCYQADAKHPKSNCYKCDPAASTTEWTAVGMAGTRCWSNHTCGGLVCIGIGFDGEDAPGVCSCACTIGGPCPVSYTGQMVCSATPKSNHKFWCQ